MEKKNKMINQTQLKQLLNNIDMAVKNDQESHKAISFVYSNNTDFYGQLLYVKIN